MSDLSLRIASLHVHPVKSCAGFALERAVLDDTGLRHDRQWLVVDEQGRFLTQREEPRMALLATRLEPQALVMSAPGLAPLRLPLAVEPGPRRRVTVWRDEVEAFDLGDAAAGWFGEHLRRPVRVVRFDPAVQRLSDPQWAGSIVQRNGFADGFPLLVASSAGLAELNRRLGAGGVAPVGIERFRPNLVLDGLDANGEDFLDELAFATPQGRVVLKLVKPCVRCTIPSVDPASGVQGVEPSDTLSAYRADARMNGGITFGMNAVIVEGAGCTLAAGMAGEATIAF